MANRFLSLGQPQSQSPQEGVQPPVNRFLQYLQNYEAPITTPDGQVVGDSGYRPTAEDLTASGRDPSFAGVPTGETRESAPVPREAAPKDIEGFVIQPDPIAKAFGWNDKPTPVPPRNMDAVQRVVLGGLHNAGVETARVTNAISDKIRGTDTTEQFNKSFPRYINPNAGFIEQAAQGTVEYLPGMLFGGGAAGAFQKAAGIGMGSNATKLAVKAVGADIGGSMLTGNPNDKTLVVGPDSLLKGMTGVGVAADGTVQDGDLLTKKVHLAMDNLIAGGFVSGAFGLLGQVFKNLAPGPQISNIATMGSKSKQEQLVMRRLLEAGDYLGSPERLQDHINDIKSNKSVTAFLEDGFSDMENVVINNPTARILIEDYKKNAANMPDGNTKTAILENIAKFENAMRTHGGPKLEAATDATVDQLSRANQSIYDTVGGNETVQKAGPRLADVAKEDVRVAQTQLDVATQGSKNIEAKVQQEIANNPLFGEFVNRTTNSGQTINTRLQDTSTNVVQKLMNAGKVASERVKAAYAKIPDNILGDLNSVNSVLDEIDGSVYSPEIKSKIGLLRSQIDKSGGDLKQLLEIANFNGNDIIDQLKQSGKQNAGDLVKKLKTALTTGQLDILDAKITKLSGAKKKTSDLKKYKNAVLNAREVWMKEMLPWRENPIADEILSITNNYSGVKGVEVPGQARDTFVSGYEQATKGGGRGSPEVITGDPLGRDLTNLMNTQVQPGSGNDITKFSALRVAERLNEQLANNPNIRAKDIGPMRAQVERELYPMLNDSDRADFTKFFDTMRDTGVRDADKLDELIVKLQKSVEGSEEQYYNTMKGFFDNNKQLKADSYEGFKSLYSSPERQNDLRLALNLANQSGDETITKGIQGSFSRYLKDNMFGVQTRPTGVPTVNVETLAKLNNPEDTLAQNFKLIYGEPFYNQFTKLTNAIYKDASVIGRQQDALINPSSVQKAGQVGVNSVITWFFGVLNPRAAALRTVTGNYMNKNTVTPYIEEILDEVLANPKEYVRIAEQILAQEKRSKILPDVKRLVKRAMLRGTMYAADGDQRGTIGTETDTPFGLSTTGDEEQSVDQQTENAFGN